MKGVLVKIKDVLKSKRVWAIIGLASADIIEAAAPQKFPGLGQVVRNILGVLF